MANGVGESAVAEGFFFLQADARHKFVELLTRPFGEVQGIGQILIGLDADSHRHLLIPVPRDTVAPHALAGSSLQLRIRSEGLVGQYLDLACTSSALSMVFERLCSDVIDRLALASGNPVATLKSTLDDWRALFAGAKSVLSRESLLGLIGELEVLAMLARREPVAALEAWVGPTGALRDFTMEGAAIEVKCTSAQDGGRVTISSLDQLDPKTATGLFLAAVHLRPDPAAPSLDDRIRNLMELGVPAYGLIKKVGSYGHIFESGDQDDALFRLESIRCWRIRDDFPGLRRSELDTVRLNGVENVKYDLLLDVLGAPLAGSDILDMEKRFAWDH